jgi:hypothetical protein
LPFGIAVLIRLISRCVAVQSHPLLRSLRPEMEAVLKRYHLGQVECVRQYRTQFYYLEVVRPTKCKAVGWRLQGRELVGKPLRRTETEKLYLFSSPLTQGRAMPAHFPLVTEKRSHTFSTRSQYNHYVS